MTRLN